MPLIAMSYALGCVFVIVVAVLVRLGRMPGLGKAGEGRNRAAASTWLYVEAVILALLGVLYLVQRTIGGEPNAYTAIRLTLTAAIFVVMVPIVLIFRSWVQEHK